MIGISINSLVLPYYGLKHLEKNQKVEIALKIFKGTKRFTLKNLIRENQKTLLRVLDY